MAFQQIIGKCRKYGRYIALQVEKTSASEGKILGSYTLTSKAFNSQTHADRLISGVPCPKCGNKMQGGCSCAAGACRGIPSAACRTCSELILDYTRDVAATAQYGEFAGQNIVSGEKDRFGNAAGSRADLGRDGAFQGKKITGLWLCFDRDSDSVARANIERSVSPKGFSVEYFTYKAIPDPARLEQSLKTASQFWLIADRTKHLTESHYQKIISFYESGRGLYLWSDNDPYFADTNHLLHSLFNAKMSGDYLGDKVIGISAGGNSPGIANGHLIATGIQSFYEGITISTVSDSPLLSPLVYDSERKVVTAFCDRDGRRCLIDGGFTRLYHKWDTAGTDRYVRNAAAWLANAERFWWEYQS